MFALKHGSRVTRAAASLGLALLLAGCLFTPRDAEPPDSGQTVTYLDRTQPRLVWSNLEISLRFRHTPGWEDGIGQPDFVYVPDADAASQFPGVFDTWGRARELEFIRTLYSSAGEILAVLRNDDFVVPPNSGQLVQWEGVIYDVTVINLDNTETRYRGAANITFNLVGNFWFVTRWEDTKGESDPDNPGVVLPTLGVLRGTISGK